MYIARVELIGIVVLRAVEISSFTEELIGLVPFILLFASSVLNWSERLN